MLLDMVSAPRQRRVLGRPSRARELGGAAALAAGAVVLAIFTVSSHLVLEEYLLVLGAAATLAWLIDGTGLRYLGAGTVALALGGGITLGDHLSVHDPYVVVFGLIGVALLLVRLVNPTAVGGSAGFLIYVSLTLVALDYIGSYDASWELVAILGFWSLLQVARIARTSPTKAPRRGLPAR